SDSNESNTEAAQTFWHIAVLEFFTDAGQGYDCKCPTSTCTRTVDHTFTKVVIALDHKQDTTHDGAVNSNQRQEYTESVIQSRNIFIQNHFHDLYYRCNHSDISD